MKKLLATALLIGTVGFAAPAPSQAETLDIDSLVYPASTPNTYYSFDFWDYLTSYKDITKNDFEYMKLTNGNTYDFFDYLFAYSTHANLADSLNQLVVDDNTVNVTTKLGKLANDGTIMDASAEDTTTAPEPEVREFKVIDIK